MTLHKGVYFLLAVNCENVNSHFVESCKMATNKLHGMAAMLTT